MCEPDAKMRCVGAQDRLQNLLAEIQQQLKIEHAQTNKINAEIEELRARIQELETNIPAVDNDLEKKEVILAAWQNGRTLITCEGSEEPTCDLCADLAEEIGGPLISAEFEGDVIHTVTFCGYKYRDIDSVEVTQQCFDWLLEDIGTQYPEFVKMFDAEDLVKCCDNKRHTDQYHEIEFDATDGATGGTTPIRTTFYTFSIKISGQ